MDETQFRELSRKVDRIMNLLAIQIVNNKDIDNPVTLLSNAGFQPKEIARLTGMTPNAVSIFLFRRKKEGIKWQRSKAKKREIQSA